MVGYELNAAEMAAIKPGEALSFAAVMCIITVAVMAVVVYKLLRAGEGGVKLPGGWTFNWK
jgi:hypothetical protein